MSRPVKCQTQKASLQQLPRCRRIASGPRSLGNDAAKAWASRRPLAGTGIEPGELKAIESGALMPEASTTARLFHLYDRGSIIFTRRGCSSTRRRQ